jgi:hypothetical protein
MLGRVPIGALIEIKGYRLPFSAFIEGRPVPIGALIEIKGYSLVDVANWILKCPQYGS